MSIPDLILSPALLFTVPSEHNTKDGLEFIGMKNSCSFYQIRKTQNLLKQSRNQAVTLEIS